MNKRDVLFIRPSDCRYCWQGFYGLGHVVDYAATKSFNISDLTGTNADNPYIDDTVNSFNPYLIYGFGHGNVNVYTANSETPVWYVGEDLSHLAGRIIYLMSCLTANQLGPYLVAQGALSYGGFLVSWTWLTDDVYGDPYIGIAEGFWKSANKFFESLLDGNTMATAMQDSVDTYNYWIQYWTDNGNSEAVKWLIHDRDGLVIYGDSNASSIDCDEFTTKTECIDAGCWWYNGACHCDAPSDVRDTYDFTVEATPSKAIITKFDAWYSTGYNADLDGMDWVDYNLRIKNGGNGLSTIFVRLLNENLDPSHPEYVIWEKYLNLNPGFSDKLQCRVTTYNEHQTHHLIAGHIEDGEEVIDDEDTKEYNFIDCHRIGYQLWPLLPLHEIPQPESKNNIFAIKLTPPEDCQAVAIEYVSNETLWSPEPKMGAAIYKVSDGSLVASTEKGYERSGSITTKRIHFDSPVPLTGGVEYWFAVMRRVNSYGITFCQRVDGVLGIGTRMAHNPEDPIPDTFVPETSEDECYIKLLYK